MPLAPNNPAHTVLENLTFGTKPLPTPSAIDAPVASTLASSPLAELWMAAPREGDVPGPFWAALTHPLCDSGVQDAMCKDLHMFQHQAGAGVRLEMARFQALVEENGVMGRELGRVQERITRVMAEKTSTVEQLQSQLVRARAAVLAKDSQLDFLQHDLLALQAMVPQLQEFQRLQHRLHRQTQHVQALQAHNSELRRQLTQTQRAPIPAPPAGCKPEACRTSHDIVGFLIDILRNIQIFSDGKRCVFVVTRNHHRPDSGFFGKRDRRLNFVSCRIDHTHNSK